MAAATLHSPAVAHARALPLPRIRACSVRNNRVSLQPHSALLSSSKLSTGSPKARWQGPTRSPTRCTINSNHKECAPSHTVGTRTELHLSPPPWTFFKIGLLAVVPLIFGAFFGTEIVTAAEHSIGTSSLGLKVATFLRGSGWSDESVVAFIASLPVLELRGAIPVGYWMRLPPLKTYILATAGNMVPVPFVVLYLAKLFNYISSRSKTGERWIEKVLENTRRKAAPIQEFQWLGLMLFVAVPFPGTGAWTGAFAGSILGMTFWEVVSANFLGVLLAGVLVNLVVSVGIREAVLVGIILFILSTFMWQILRFINQRKSTEA